MNRFFVEPSQVMEEEKRIFIDGEDVKHIAKVLRLSVGDEIEVCDGVVFQYIGEITNISKNEVKVKIIKKEELTTEAPIDVILYQGLPKGTKMELIIQKTTEMGIKEIVPMASKRAVVQLKDDKDKEKKTERWNKIALEAAKQSKRGVVPVVRVPLSFQEALVHSRKNDINLVAYEGEKILGLSQVLKDIKEKEVKRIGIFIGPEGGFSEEEIEKIGEEAAVEVVTLGPRILRTETAGFALLSMLMYELGDLGGAFK